MGLNVSYRHFGNRAAAVGDVGRERGGERTYEANSHGDLTRLKKGGTKEDERGGRERDVQDKMDRTWERQKKREREVT
ncbi:hypothetical protein VZT92_027526 [Zoarces viviparus]|uniref:Uncharacterized protein n=1 Tax=Zoarces viviparus TaxID=48416 RepID=A0AAW1DWZ1_ZOAVI